MASVYTVNIVSRDGTLVYGPVVGAVVKSVERVLNSVGQAVFTFPKYDPTGHTGQGANIHALYNEVQILKDGALYWWGVPLMVRADSAKGDVEVTCADLGWYFTRRAVDKLEDNFLLNPDFETGLTSWIAVGTPAAVVATDRFERGTQAIRMTGGTGDDDYIHQSITVTTGGVIGIVYFVVGWVWVESYTDFALGGRGLYVEARAGGAFQASAQVNIDETTPQGQWVRMSTQINVPAGVTWVLDVRLYAPVGSVVWDASELVEMESLGLFNGDMADLARKVVNYIQDTANNGGKDDLLIAQGGATTGVVYPSKWWQFADHTMADRALDEFVQASPGIDWTIELAVSYPTLQYGSGPPTVAGGTAYIDIVAGIIYAYSGGWSPVLTLSPYTTGVGPPGGTPTALQGYWDTAGHDAWACTAAVGVWDGAAHAYPEGTLSGATRTFTVHYPSAGTDRTGTVTIALGSNVAHYAYSEDGSSTSTDVTVLGVTGTGPDREVGHDRDTSSLGGLVLQEINSCTPGALTNQLDGQASARLAVAKRLVKLVEPVTVQASGDLVGTLGLGDKVTGALTDGWVQVTSPYRIIRILHDTVKDTLTLTMNEA